MLSIFWILLLIFFFLTILSFTIKSIKRRTKFYPIQDIGVLILIVLGLYYIIPILSFVVLGKSANIIFSGRFSGTKSMFGNMIYILLIVNTFALGIYAVYRTSKQNIKHFFNKKDITHISKPIIFASILIYILLQLIIVFMNIKFNLYNIEGYINSYVAFRNIPKSWAQIFLLIQFIANFSKIIILIGLFQKWRKNKLLIVIIFLFSVLNYNVDGARTGLVLNLLILFVLYNFYIKRASSKTLILIGVFFIISFSILGIIRSDSKTIFKHNSIGLNIISIINSGEQVSIFGNSIHLLNEKESGNLDIPWAAHINDLISFIPSQLIPWEKQDYATWYVKKYYYAYYKAGGGLSFGLVSQIIGGFGIPGAFIFGLVWGKLSLFINLWVKNSKKWWVFPYYLMIYLSAYQVVRSSSFSLITGSMLKIIFTIVLIKVVAAILFKTKNKYSQ